MPSNHLIFWLPLLLLPSVFPRIRVFSSELDFCIRYPKYWSFSFSISPSNEYSGLISFSIGWFDILAVQGLLKSLLQHHKIWKHQFLGAQPSSQSISTCINIVLYDKNSVGVICITNTRHQQWKDNVKKKFTFTYIYINSNSHVEDEAAALWLFYVD